MMRFLFALLCILITNTHACEFLDGHWKSDNRISMEYNRGIDGIPDQSMQLFQQIFGIQELVYTRESVYFLPAPELEVHIDGNSYPMQFEERNELVVITQCSPELVKVTMNVEIEANYDIHFESKDLYWVSPFGTWREYFARVR